MTEPNPEGSQTPESHKPPPEASRVSLARSVLSRKVIPILLAEAGLVFGAWIRVPFFRSFPDSIPTPDTWSYLTGAFGLLQKGHFDLYPQRTPVFPLIVWITLALFKSFAALNVVQGLLTLLSAAAVGFVLRAFGGPWRWPAALAVIFVALHPHVLFWEHFVMTDGSFQAFFVFSLGAAAWAILRPTPRRAAIAGILAAITVLIRPQAMFLTALMVLALAWTGRRLARRKLLLIVIAAIAGPLLLLGGWSARNAAVHGFFGLSDLGPITYFSIAAPWVELESPTLAADKALIAESIRRYRSMPEDPNWVAYNPEGPTVILAQKYASDINRRDEVLNELAREAILHHPMVFLRRGLHSTYLLVTSRVTHASYDFAAALNWENEWKEIAKSSPVDQYRAALNQTRFPMPERDDIYTSEVRPILQWEMPFIQSSLYMVGLAILALPFLRGPRRIATAMVVISIIFIILATGFLAQPAERYLTAIHGSAALAGALAFTGLVERWQERFGRPRTRMI